MSGLSAESLKKLEALDFKSRDFIVKLLKLNPAERLGCKDIDEIFSHEIF